MRPSAAFDLLIKQAGRGVFAFENRAGTSGDSPNAPTGPTARRAAFRPRSFQRFAMRAKSPLVFDSSLDPGITALLPRATGNQALVGLGGFPRAAENKAGVGRLFGPTHAGHRTRKPGQGILDQPWQMRNEYPGQCDSLCCEKVLVPGIIHDRFLFGSEYPVPTAKSGLNHFM